MEKLAQKKLAAQAALAHIPQQAVLGVGTGSSVNCLIELLPSIKGRIKTLVSSSKETTARQ